MRMEAGRQSVFNDSTTVQEVQVQNKLMKHRQAGSETHPQEHRFEFRRAARENTPLVELCSWTRVRFAAPVRALFHCGPFCTGSNCDGRLRWELKSLALCGDSEERPFNPLRF